MGAPSYHWRRFVHLCLGTLTMKKTLMLLLALAAAGGAPAQTGQAGLKAGLWETTTTRMTADGKDMKAQFAASAEQMKKQIANLRPEQRKKAEAMLAQQGDPLSRRICVSAEMAKRDQPMIPRPHNAECEQPKIDRQGNRTSFEFACKQAGGSVTGKGETVVAGDLITTKIETNGKDASGKAHTMQADTQMKYLGSDCGSVRPLDQQMKAMQSQAPAKAPAAARAPAK